jgi:hypothetical protein
MLPRRWRTREALPELNEQLSEHFDLIRAALLQ